MPQQARSRRALACVAMAVVLALGACGGSDYAPPQLPTQVTLSMPATRQALNAEVAFSSDVADPEQKLSYHWDFGDGGSSTLASPTHAYARSGTYTVQLTVRNPLGASVQSSGTVQVADLAVVQGQACSAEDHGGWCWQNPLPQGNVVYDYFWLDGQRGWAVGESGTVIATQDGGRQWQVQRSGTTLALNKVYFVDAQVGWAAGSNGLVLRTVDGGATWQQFSLGANLGVSNLRAADASTAWVSDHSGGGNRITTDGGVTWKSMPLPTGSVLSVRITSPRTAWALAYTITGVQPMRTTDAGANWAVLPLPLPETGLPRSVSQLGAADDRQAIMLVNESGWDSTGNYVSRNSLWVTRDGGATWQSVTPPAAAADDYSAQYQMTADGAVFYYNGYYGTNGGWYSVDGGANWRPLQAPPGAAQSYYVTSANFFSSTRAFFLASNGGAYLTNDAGASWTSVQTTRGYSANANSIWFFDAREGLVLTDDGNSLRTTDGGQTWTPRVDPMPCCGQSWRQMEFLPGSDTGWAVSGGQIYRSTDRGRTWMVPVPQSSDSIYAVWDYHFVDATHGWALSGYCSSGQNCLYRSVDGGASWQVVPGTANLAGMTALRFADRVHGVAVGSAGVAMVTSDGGLSWRPRPTGSSKSLVKLRFVNAQTAVAVGPEGTILRSTDRGETWQAIASPTSVSLTDLRFISDQLGTAVGVGGTVLSTADGGLTWRPTPVPTQSMLQGVFFLDAYTGWAVGVGGTILATISGGR